MTRVWRTCSDCEKHQPLENFGRSKSRPLGRTYICKPCVGLRTHAWYLKNKGRAKATGKRWREGNREKQRASSRAHYARNAERIRKQTNARRAADPKSRDVTRWNGIRRNYGLTRERWLWMFSMQNGACACCRSPDPGSKNGWHTDHDHRTGKVRGILCHKCNVMIGAARDSAAILDLGKAYLRAYS